MKIPDLLRSLSSGRALGAWLGLAALATTADPVPASAQASAAPPEAAASAAAVPADEAAGDDDDFVRFVTAEDSGNDSDQLQTVVRSYHRGRQRVDLVSVVHIGDSGYYEELNKKLGGYDVVLYEMVGGPFEERDTEVSAEDSDPAMSGLRFAHALLQNLLALEYQIEGIDYSADHFVHADVDWQQYDQLMTDRNQSMATLFQRALAISLSGEEVPGVPTTNEESNAMMVGLLQAITTGDANGLKRIVAPMLGNAEGLIGMIEGDDGTVIITERNKVVMKAVREHLAAGEQSVAVFYGAGHMPDLEDRLEQDGFEAGEIEWMTAWDIGPSPTPAITDKPESESEPEGAPGPAGADPAKPDAGTPGAAAPRTTDDAMVNAFAFFGRILQDENLVRSAIVGVRALAGGAE